RRRRSRTTRPPSGSPTARPACLRARGRPLRSKRSASRLFFFYDVALHRTERAEQLIFLVRADLERVEGAHEILDQRVEVRAADAHAHVCALHVLALVLARPATRLADLLDGVAPELLHPRGT